MLVRLHALLFFLLICPASISLAGDFTVLTNDVPPIKMVSNGMPSGVTGDILLKIMRENGIRIEKGDTKRMPLAQAYDKAKNSPGTVILGLARTPKREPDFKWVGPVYTTSNGLITRKGRTFHLKQVTDAAAYKVGTIKASASERAAFKLGLPRNNVTRFSTTKEAIEQLASGKIDMIVFPKSPAFYLMLQMGIDPNEFTILYEMSSIDIHLAFNKATNDDLLLSLQKSLDALKFPGKEGRSEYDAICGKYFMPM